MAPLAGTSWLELDADARVVVRHGPSSREFELTGPGRVLPCRAGLEQVLIARGKFESSTGAGVRPGAEMWVVTPFAALRYGDAAVALRVERNALVARLQSGRLSSEAELGPTSHSELGPPSGAHSGALLEKRWTRQASPVERVKRCEAVAREARGRAEQVLTATSDLGTHAAEQLESRRRARAECLVAETMLDSVREPGDKSRLSDQLRAANELWQGIPTMVR